MCIVLLRNACVKFNGQFLLSSRCSFRASTRPNRLTAFALVRLVKYHNAFVLIDSTLCDHLALLARANGRLLLLGLDFLIEPFLTNGVFGWILERVERGVVVAAVTIETGCCLCVLLDMIDALKGLKENCVP